MFLGWPKCNVHTLRHGQRYPWELILIDLVAQCFFYSDLCHLKLSSPLGAVSSTLQGICSRSSHAPHSHQMWHEQSKLLSGCMGMIYLHENPPDPTSKIIGFWGPVVHAQKWSFTHRYGRSRTVHDVSRCFTHPCFQFVFIPESSKKWNILVISVYNTAIPTIYQSVGLI